MQRRKYAYVVAYQNWQRNGLAGGKIYISHGLIEAEDMHSAAIAGRIAVKTDGYVRAYHVFEVEGESKP